LGWRGGPVEDGIRDHRHGPRATAERRPGGAAARLSLAEKGVEYDLVPVDVFAKEGPPPGYLDRHPFGRIPAFEHAGFLLYETGAIARYIDEAFEGPKLQPADIGERARCNQLISIADNYAYPNLVWGIYVERVSKPKRGAVADEAKIGLRFRLGGSEGESALGVVAGDLMQRKR